ncbi:RHS repeat-associated core domain-containing protein, partial [Bacteroides faecichinchillae]
QTVEYAYDKNGNLIKDLNKNISNIGYNCLNLPSQITLAGSNSIDYEYGADGTKLRTVHKTGAATLTTDYCGNAVYENGVLRMLLNEAGYVSFPDRKFHFYLKDHQGNVRVVADKDGNVEETNAYYPFGGTFTSTNSVQPYKYNGKELDTRNGLNWYDYGARHYDAAIGRWHAIDPKCEKYNYLSPYVYCNNGPIDKIDPTGEDWYRDNNGNLRWVEGSEEIEGCERLGSSVSISLGDGLYLNAYQNGGIIANQAVNAFDLIAGSGKLQKQFLGNQSPLSEDSKSALFNGLTSRGVDAIARPVGEFLVEQGVALMGGKLLGWGIGKLAGQFASKSSSVAQAVEASSIGNEAAVGTHSVYIGKDASGTIRYVGITGREPSVRFLEHLHSGTARGALKYEVVKGAKNLTRTQARVWEQTLINRYGMEKNGGTLLNKINSIAPKNWAKYGIK